MKTQRPASIARGFSLPEVTTCVAIIGVLASIAIMAYTKTLDSSRSAVAGSLLETVNSAVHRFNEGNYELLVTADDSSTSDEFTVLRALQYRNPVYPKPGSPYMTHDWNPAASSNTTEYRLIWTGSLFKLASPGTSGLGLKVNFDGSDLGTPYQFPQGYALP